MRRTFVLAGVIGAAAHASPSHAAPNMDLSQDPPAWSVHQKALVSHAGAATPLPRAVSRDVVPTGTHSRTVMGYLPYWELDTEIPWDRLTHLAYFGAELDPYGDILTDHDFTGDAGTSLIATSHGANVRVVLTAILFQSGGLAELLGDEENRNRAIQNLVSRCAEAGADGINVDFEGLKASSREDFVTFLQELRDALSLALPNAELSIAGPAIDWSDAYDYEAIAQIVDAIFIMGYAFHWSSSDPGPQCPLFSSDAWGTGSLDTSVTDYLGKGVPPEKIILGLPLYGYDWRSESEEIPAAAIGKGTVVFHENTVAETDADLWQWDDASQSSYYAYHDDGDHQVWVDTSQSLAVRFDYAKEKNLMGVGFWALGYAGPSNDLWSELSERYPKAKVPAPAPIDGDDPMSALGDGGRIGEDGPGDYTQIHLELSAATKPGSPPMLDASCSFQPHGDGPLGDLMMLLSIFGVTQFSRRAGRARQPGG